MIASIDIDEGREREAIRQAMYETLGEDLKYLLGLSGAVSNWDTDPSMTADHRAEGLRAGLMTFDILRSVGRDPVDVARPDFEPAYGSEETLALLRQRALPFSIHEQLAQI